MLSLTNIIETRKCKRKSTFVAFIDFRKAYDAINRNLLFKKLSSLRICGRMYNALTSLYENVSCCVRLNGFKTDWFTVTCGLKQGCNLSTILFNFYIDDVVEKIKATSKGIDIGDEKVSVLLYADDLILLAPSASDLQVMLDALHVWCDENKMTINEEKSNVIHFRPNSFNRTENIFTCGDKRLKIVDRYKYLGLLITEHLDYEEMAKHVAKSASRALSLLITKFKSCGGLAFRTYTKLFENTVMGIINYGAAVWGTKAFRCINSIQLKAARFFLGVGRYTPNSGVLGDVGWDPVLAKQWKSVMNQWSRMKAMNDQRINFKIFVWSEQSLGRSCKNWHYRVNHMLTEAGIEVQQAGINPRNTVTNIHTYVVNQHVTKWINDVRRENARQGPGKNKLRLYRCFKNDYETENYVTCMMPRGHRAALSKFRCGVAPIRVETGRYERLALEDRHCFICTNQVEDEEHVLLHCPMYYEIRQTLYNTIVTSNPDFMQKSNIEMLCFILGNPGDHNIIRQSAKFCAEVLRIRKNCLYK